MSLGVVYDRKGRDTAAIEHYAATTRLDPGNGRGSRVRGGCADARGQLRQGGPLYRKALDKSPGAARIQMSLAMALVRSGNHAQARALLESALAEQADNYAIANALARLLATAPEPSLRDGARALELARKVFEATRSPEVGQTYAMALAETGNFAEAVKLQQETLIAYERSKLPVFDPRSSTISNAIAAASRRAKAGRPRIRLQASQSCRAFSRLVASRFSPPALHSRCHHAA